MAESKAHDAIAPVDGPLPPSHSSEGRPSDSSMKTIIQNAKAATEKEQNMSLLQGIKLYPKAVAWSVLISTCIAMEGYDISLVNNFYGFPQFNKKYGTQLANGSYQVPAQVRFW
jgi:SP family general alpha glucoside:H+ symporter-like MFS transporter